MAISKARAKANKKWNDANPLNITYNQKKRAARNFVNTNLSADTKIAKAINYYIDTYETQVFDANEMLPWIRTFIGRILAIESDCQKLTRFFERDFLAMYRMYFKESEGLPYEE